MDDVAARTSAAKSQIVKSISCPTQETTGVLALFAQNGTIGAEAGTQLNSMLMKLAAPSTEAANTMKELGISAYDAQHHFVGMANFAGQLQKAEKNLTDEQRKAFSVFEVVAMGKSW